MPAPSAKSVKPTLFSLPNRTIFHFRLGTFDCPLCGYSSRQESLATLQATNCYSPGEPKKRWFCFVAKPPFICDCVTWGTWMFDAEVPEECLVVERQ